MERDAPATPSRPAAAASDGDSLDEREEPAVTPPRFEALGVTRAANPNFQTVKVKVAVGAHIDLMVVRGVRMRDVASGMASEPGILTLNAEHIRFNGAPNASGDGYYMITYLDHIPTEPKPRRVGGTLGGLWQPYSIELPRQERAAASGGSGGSEVTSCELIFGTNQTACDAFLAKLLEQLAIAAAEQQPQQQLNAVAEDEGNDESAPVDLQLRTPSGRLGSTAPAAA